MSGPSAVAALGGAPTPTWNGTAGAAAAGGNESGGALLLSLFTTFSLIAVGYAARRADVLPPAALGLAQFISKMALPSLVFVSIATIDFWTVQWSVVFSIAIGKTAVLLVAVLATLVTLRRAPNRVAVAGIRAIVTTQSNDFAVGLPLFSALYPPDMVRYLYLAAPVSFLWLNLIGFALMGYGNAVADKAARQAQQPEPAGGGAQRQRPLAVDVLVSVVTNPVVFMTFLGLLANFAFGGHPPPVLSAPTTMLGATFSGTALLALGMSMVGKLGLLRGPNLLTSSLLVACKCIMLPIATRAAANLFELDEYTGIFLFIYSMIPSAPGALAFALQYKVVPSETAAAIVLCTLVSAPIMFLSAKLATMKSSTEGANEAINTSGQAAFSVSAVAAACVVVLYAVVWRRLCGSAVHRSVLLMSGATVLTSVAAALCPLRQLSRPVVVGQTLSYFWGRGVVACGLVLYAVTTDAELFQRKRRRVSAWAAWAACALAPLALAAGITFQPGHPFGSPHIHCFLSGGHNIGDYYIKVSLPAVCLIAVVYSLTRRLVLRPPDGAADGKAGALGRDAADASDDGGGGGGKGSALDNERSPLLGDGAAVPSRPALRPDDAAIQGEPIGDAGHEARKGSCDVAAFRHTVYLTLEALAQTLILVNYAFSNLTRLGSVPQLEVRFLDVTFHASRGVVLFLCFGLSDDVWAPLSLRVGPVLTRWRRVLQRARERSVFGGSSNTTALPLEGWVVEGTGGFPAVTTTGEMLDRVRSVIPTLRRDRGRLESPEVYGRSFTGTELVEWMLQARVARDRDDAVALGKMLLVLGVITHVLQEHHFYDAEYLYRFHNFDVVIPHVTADNDMV